jgi:ABC-type antimicrobial peptide transport system permease subunit
VLRARQYSFEVKGRPVQSLFIAVGGSGDSGDSSVVHALGVSDLPSPGQIFISDHVKKASGLGEGDTIDIGGVPMVVAGSVGVKSPPFGSFSVLNFQDAEQIFNMAGSVSYLLVVAKDATQVPSITDEIRTDYSGVAAYTKSEFASSNSRSINEFLPVVGVLLIVSYFVGIAVASLTIYTATIEKTRDYGILKAIGSSNLRIYQIVVAQSFMVCLLGFCIALPLALVVSHFAEAQVAGFITHFQAVSVVIAFGSVLVMALLSALLPARRIATIDPAIVFRA